MLSRISPFDDVTPGQYLAGKKTAQESTWECPTCGFVLPYRVKHGPSQGRWVRRKCACSLRDEIQEAKYRNLITKAYAWLGSAYSDKELAQKTFSAFDATMQPEAFGAALNFAEQQRGNLIFHSPTFGTGKTHLLAAICNYLREENTESHFVTAPKLFRAIQDRMQKKEPYGDIIFKV